MGKYLFAVLSAISQNHSKINISLLFNTSLPIDDERLDQILQSCPGASYFFVELPLPGQKHGTRPDVQRQLEKYLNRSFPDFDISYMTNSPFHWDYYSVFPDNVAEKTMIFYDLIPLLNWSDLGHIFSAEAYMPMFEEIYRADKLFCISGATRDDLVERVGVPKDKTVVIDGGYNELSIKATKPVSFTVPKKYILFPSGQLPHKNNTLAAKAFEKFLKRNKGYYLLVTAHFLEDERRRLLKLSKNIIFTGYITDAEMAYLYKNASAVLFASKYEGLGLPILDAVAYNKPAIVSSAKVFREISHNAFYNFDMNDAGDCARAMERAVTGVDWANNQSNYGAVLEKYTWQRTGRLVAKNIFRPKPYTARYNHKKDLIIVSPHPGIEGSIGEKAEALYYSLHQKYNLIFYFDNYNNSKEVVRPSFLQFLSGVKLLPINLLAGLNPKDHPKLYFLLEDDSLKNVIAEYAYVFHGQILPISKFNHGNVFAKAILQQAKIVKEMPK